MTVYKLFCEQLYSDACGAYTAYGIAVCRDGVTVRTLSDVTTDKAKLLALTERFNDCQLEPVHLDRAVEDFLFDLEV